MIQDWLILGAVLVVIAGMAAVDLVADGGSASLVAVWVSEASF